MATLLTAFIAALQSIFRTRAALQLENLALRHRIGVLRRSAKKRPKLAAADLVLWVWLCGVRHDCRSALVAVKPETVIAWPRQGFRLFWTWKVRHGQQLRDAFLWDTAPRYLLLDRDRLSGNDFTEQVEEMSIKEVLSAPRSPLQ